MEAHPRKVKFAEFQMQNKQRQIAQLDSMIDEFENMIATLERQIEKGIGDNTTESGHKQPNINIQKKAKCIYPFSGEIFMQATRQRRDNLRISVDDLKRQRIEVITELDELEMRKCHLQPHPSPIHEYSSYDNYNGTAKIA